LGAPAGLGVLAPEAAVAKATHKDGGHPGAPTPWKFGVMADTQWQKNIDGLNPSTCAVGVVNLLNAQFVHHDVKFVIQVGDLIDSETDAINGNASARTLPTRAAAAEALYDCGIGYFPLRGNHEGSSIAANEFPGLFQQTQGKGSRVFGAGNFSSPFSNLNGLTYSFDYNNVRFVLIDQFLRTDGSGDASANINTIDQLPWIESRLAGRPSGSHAFVLGHKNLIGQDHVDCLFGADPSQNPSARSEFIGALASTGVRYYLGGPTTCTIARSSPARTARRRSSGSSVRRAATSSTRRRTRSPTTASMTTRPSSRPSRRRSTASATTSTRWTAPE
jgi:hypothetical protein